MERQRSFSLKPNRLLLLSISSSLLFCFLLSIWVLRNSCSSTQESHLQFSSGLKAAEAQRFATSSSNSSGGGAKDSILEETHSGEVANSSGEVLDSAQESKDAILRDTQFSETIGSVSKRKDSILATDSAGEKENTHIGERHLNKSDVSSEEVVVSGVGRFEGKIQESDVFIVGKEGSIGAGIRSSDEDAAVNSTASVVGKIESTWGTCDVSNGRWVFYESYPLYTNNSCPFIDEGFSCETNGRLDGDYMKWRWQPHDCNIPRFDAVKMLELIRGKRLVFVGDSINRNQWESMLCLLRGGVSDPKLVYEAHGRRITKEKGNYNFKFVDYHCSVEYYVTHFLVHEGKARIGQKRKPTLRIDTIDRSSSKWRGADILVFNTAHWWSHYKTKAGINYYQEGNQVHPRLDVSTAFRRALITWASWVDRHVTPGKTQVFFRTSSPSHFRGGEWNSGGHCKESTQPLNQILTRNSPEKNTIVEEIIKQMRTPVTLLSITTMSGLRIDGHPSIYGINPRKGSPKKFQDCSHWCLPGVPDTWNELLYFHLLSKQKIVSVN